MIQIIENNQSQYKQCGVNPTFLQANSIEIKYWEKINIDTINCEKLFW